MENLIRTIVQAIEDKKGKDIVSLDLTGFDGAICSHFVVCNACLLYTSDAADEQ